MSFQSHQDLHWVIIHSSLFAYLKISFVYKHYQTSKTKPPLNDANAMTNKHLDITVTNMVNVLDTALLLCIQTACLSTACQCVQHAFAMMTPFYSVIEQGMCHLTQYSTAVRSQGATSTCNVVVEADTCQTKTFAFINSVVNILDQCALDHSCITCLYKDMLMYD